MCSTQSVDLTNNPVPKGRTGLSVAHSRGGGRTQPPGMSHAFKGANSIFVIFFRVYSNTNSLEVNKGRNILDVFLHMPHTYSPPSYPQ